MTLTVSGTAGTTLHATAGSGIIVQGKLEIDGTSAAPVVLTSAAASPASSPRPRRTTLPTPSAPTTTRAAKSPWLDAIDTPAPSRETPLTRASSTMRTPRARNQAAARRSTATAVAAVSSSWISE